jgi:hypothetical protein
MRTHFAEVLARESAYLAGVADRAMPAGWRRRVVEELLTPKSPYVLALRQTVDAPDRADFLDRWRRLIAETVGRLLQPVKGNTLCSSAQTPRADGDAQKTANSCGASWRQHPEPGCPRPWATRCRARLRALAFCGDRGQQPRKDGERVARLVIWTRDDDR